jgi:hypothetical protein
VRLYRVGFSHSQGQNEKSAFSGLCRLPPAADMAAPGHATAPRREAARIRAISGIRSSAPGRPWCWWQVPAGPARLGRGAKQYAPCQIHVNCIKVTTDGLSAKNGEEPMSSHKFKVGDIGAIKATISRFVPSGVFEVTKQLPGNSEPEYRIKSANEPHERVALESELTKA